MTHDHQRPDAARLVRDLPSGDELRHQAVAPASIQLGRCRGHDFAATTQVRKTRLLDQIFVGASNPLAV